MRSCSRAYTHVRSWIAKFTSTINPVDQNRCTMIAGIRISRVVTVSVAKLTAIICGALVALAAPTPPAAAAAAKVPGTAAPAPTAAERDRVAKSPLVAQEAAL